jgi:hypothetical protein
MLFTSLASKNTYDKIPKRCEQLIALVAGA